MGSGPAGKPAESARGAGGAPRTPAAGARLAVLQLVGRGSQGAGAATQALALAGALVRRGHAVTVAAPPLAGVASGCEAVGAAHLALPLRDWWDLLSLRRLNAHLARHGADVLHARGRGALALALGAHRRGGLPVVVAERGTSFRPTPLAALAYRSRRLQRVVATCEHVREVILSHAAVAPARVEVVHAGVDLARFDPAACDAQRARRALGVTDDVALLGHVGMQDWRGWKELLRALPAIRARHPEAHLVLAGCRSERQRRAVLEAAAEMGLQGHVSALATVSDLRELLAACRVVVDPSWAGTGLSVTLLQAMALARPVVATAYAGNPEAVEPGVSGILVPPHDVASLAAAVVRLLDEPAAAARLGGAARRRVRARFSLDDQAARLERVYRHALRDLRLHQRPDPGRPRREGR